MAAGNWTLTSEGRTKLSTGEWLDADTYKIALFQSTSNIGAGSTTYAALTNEVANSHGYTTGGASTTLARTGTTDVNFTHSDVTFTASGGTIVGRFAVMYEVSGRVLAYCLLDSTPADYTIADGNSLTIHSPSGVIDMA